MATSFAGTYTGRAPAVPAVAPAPTRTATGTTPGVPAAGYDPAYGGIPYVPSLIDVYGQSLGANQANLPAITALGTSLSGATEEELLGNLRLALPGYDASVAQSMGNIGALQRGQIPTDVSNLIKQQAAERGIATGLYNSPNANAALLSALGQTSLGLQGEGEKQMTALVNRTPQAQPYDVSKLLLSPTDLYESQLLANTYAAAPVPKAAAQQLISDQLAGYKTGLKNVPSYSSGAPTPGGAYVPIPRGGDPLNPPAVGALGPFDTTPAAPWKPVMGNLRGGGGGIDPAVEWDPEMGSYYNRYTGQYLDYFGDEGDMTWGGANADTPIDWGDVEGPVASDAIYDWSTPYYGA